MKLAPNFARLSRRQVLIAGGLASGMLASGAWTYAATSKLHSSRRMGTAFGTTVSLKAVHSNPQQLNVGLDAAWDEITKVQDAANLFSPTTALSRLNRDGHIDDAPAALIEMLKVARDISDLTNGAFDITVQPLWRLYETSYSTGRAPTSEEIRSVRKLIGQENVVIEGSNIQLVVPGMALTLNGIAQGYATERCLRVLQAHGIHDAFLDTGEIGAVGDRNGSEPWRAGIADPRHEGQHFTLAKPLSGILATSGDYATSFTEDFSTHHIFDPKTLASPTELASVSVLAQSGAHADALATAMMVMPIEDSLALARQLKDVDVLAISKQGEITRTPGFAIS